MKNFIILVCLTLAILFLFQSCSKQSYVPLWRGPYLGQQSPGMTAKLFDPGIFNEGEFLGCSGFFNSGTVFVYGSMKPDSDWRLRPVYITEMKKGGRWTKPEIAPFSRYSPYNFTVGPDDQTLYFTTLRSPDKTTHMFGEQANIWAVKLEMDGWTEPVMMGRSINTERYYENYPSVTIDGTIYYMSRREVGGGRTDVWRSKNLDGVYGEAENLGSPVNTEVSDFDPFVAADESYLIVCQEFERGFGKSDLYVYFQREDQSWTAAINLGDGVNSSGFEARPYVTPDGKYLFFTSNRAESEGGEGIYWVDTKVIDHVMPQELK
jgi:hypothetical protein